MKKSQQINIILLIALLAIPSLNSDPEHPEKSNITRAGPALAAAAMFPIFTQIFFDFVIGELRHEMDELEEKKIELRKRKEKRLAEEKKEKERRRGE